MTTGTGHPLRTLADRAAFEAALPLDARLPGRTAITMLMSGAPKLVAHTHRGQLTAALGCAALAGTTR